MLNQVIVVGRLVDNPQKEILENGKEVSKMTLAVSRSYKNEEGIYETDFVDVVLWNNISSNVNEYCHKGDIVGIKGRLQTETNNDKKNTNVIAEKVTFLSSKHSNDDEKKEEE